MEIEIGTELSFTIVISVIAICIAFTRWSRHKWNKTPLE